MATERLAQGEKSVHSAVLFAKGVESVTKLKMFDLSSSDTLSWKQGSCATLKINKM